MANPPRSRKRVQAIQRAPDGSAFEKCDCCCDLVPIALIDMHDCRTGKDVKRFKGIFGKPNVNKQSFCDQPRSAFKFFMERFKETYKTGTVIDIDEKGFETWKNISKEERQPYIIEAEKVNSAYNKALIQEVNDMFEVDDEADSSKVGKFEQVTPILRFTLF
ncbi:HMG_box domain-containing protein [Cephalotus follicularis]|uniref:HMG_box domain-containing protein n=1 Tax=Cephalotus follicularis TaxID=3775 RepID=A0A1Q3CLG6_CEPFO|nr:HMG_box domain-containing protein [Cephalotus follicularis]